VHEVMNQSSPQQDGGGYRNFNHRWFMALLVRQLFTTGVGNAIGENRKEKGG
jgi:hypothetical protein